MTTARETIKDLKSAIERHLLWRAELERMCGDLIEQRDEAYFRLKGLEAVIVSMSKTAKK